MMNIFGIVGWSGSGKTDLVTRLINFFVLNSLVVSSVKHTHHQFQIDKEGKDSFKHINAGSSEVIIFSKKRWAMMSKLHEQDIKFEEILNKFNPKTNIILVEGLKYSNYPKIEVIRSTLNKPLLFKNDKNIEAIVYDKEFDGLENINKPYFMFNETNKIGNFIKNYFKL